MKLSIANVAAVFFAAFLVAAIFVLLCVLLLNTALRSTMDAVDWQEETYTVEEGDSLWTISYAYCPVGVDRREWVDEVQALNNMAGCTIYPGQQLTVLVPAEGGAL